MCERFSLILKVCLSSAALVKTNYKINKPSSGKISTDDSISEFPKTIGIGKTDRKSKCPIKLAVP